MEDFGKDEVNEAVKGVTDKIIESFRIYSINFAIGVAETVVEQEHAAHSCYYPPKHEEDILCPAHQIVVALTRLKFK